MMKNQVSEYIKELESISSYYFYVFDFVELDSSFYRIPNAFMVKNWCKKTPNHFRFTAKFPKVITHDKRLKDVERELEQFFSSMINLEDKILALLIQLPPSLGIVEGMNGLTCIIPELDKIFRYAVEIVRGFRIWHIVFLQITICAWSEVKLLDINWTTDE